MKWAINGLRGCVKNAWGAEYTERMTRSLRWLKDDIALRMMQKLELLKHQPRSLLIIPDAPGIHASHLGKRFPQAGLASVLAPNLSWVDTTKMKLTRTCGFITKGVTRFPTMTESRIALPDQSQDMVFSNLWIHSLDEPKWVVQEAWRVLREGGLFSFSYLGPDTGAELRAMQSQSMGDTKAANLPGAWDMHDLGDALVESRFSDPVMDMEYLYLEYESDALYLKDALALGLLSEQQVLTISADKTVKLPQKMTLEVVYGHAWVVGKHLSGTKDTLAFISPDQIKRKNS
jgi:malonyl-CoA O-methyltransferase